jgi:nucleotide-binding universal stress UspA family protein
LHSFNPVCHLVKGSHRDEIVRLAVTMGADLVVVGGLAQSGITGFIVDSTAESIARYLNCSVLVVKPPDFVTPVTVEDP